MQSAAAELLLAHGVAYIFSSVIIIELYFGQGVLVDTRSRFVRNKKQ